MNFRTLLPLLPLVALVYSGCNKENVTGQHLPMPIPVDTIAKTRLYPADTVSGTYVVSGSWQDWGDSYINGSIVNDTIVISISGDSLIVFHSPQIGCIIPNQGVLCKDTTTNYSKVYNYTFLWYKDNGDFSLEMDFQKNGAVQILSSSVEGCGGDFSSISSGMKIH